jgi:hypothetical protein
VQAALVSFGLFGGFSPAQLKGVAGSTLFAGLPGRTKTDAETGLA